MAALVDKYSRNSPSGQMNNPWNKKNVGLGFVVIKWFNCNDEAQQVKRDNGNVIRWPGFQKKLRKQHLDVRFLGK